MLKRAPSLAVRAAAIFTSFFVAIFLAVLCLVAAASLSDPGKGNHGGAVLALEYAAEELQHADGVIRVPADGRFAEFAAKNDAIWLIVESNGRSLSYGAVPASAVQLINQLRDVVDAVQFRVPGVPMPLAVGVLERRQFESTSVLLVAGGVDPGTLSPVDSVRLFLDGIVLGILGFVALISLLTIPIAIRFFSRALTPITNEAAALEPQDASRRLDEDKAPRELLPLVRGFNAALDRLQIELGRRKRFVADVAHELRTPLSVVSLRVEALDDEEAKGDLRRGLGRLTHLVVQMLDLERLSLSSETRSDIDLGKTAGDVLSDLAPMAIKAGYDLLLVAPDHPVIVSADAQAATRAITNLVGNSIVHGGAAGEIAVVVGADGTLDVTDEGPGVSPALQTRLFEPFSRESSNADGSGLGLHLTREIMRAHGGDVRLVPTERGASFRLRFAAPAGEATAKPLQ